MNFTDLIEFAPHKDLSGIDLHIEFGLICNEDMASILLNIKNVYVGSSMKIDFSFVYGNMTTVQR